MSKNLNEMSERMQLKAVKRYGLAIEFIKNPSYKIKLESVKQDRYAIRYIINPSEELKIEAIKQSPSIIKDLNMDNNDINNILKYYPDIKLIQILIDIDYKFTKEFINSGEYIKDKLLMK